MRALLDRQNRAILGDAEALHVLLAGVLAPAELEPYRLRTMAFCRQLQQTATGNLADLALGHDDILEDVLSNTQQALRGMRLLSSHLAVPVLRTATSDRLGLAIIGWLHDQHPQTRAYPPAFSDGACSILPFVGFPPIYFFPCLEQRGLLYLPLLFHEFGHLLYACHKREMDDLVGELQRAVEDLLLPASRRDDWHAIHQAAERRTIVDTWYEWAQEFFCDAVGLVVGGPCYLRGFSAFLASLDPGAFYRSVEELARSPHPVTWLRIQLLCRRAETAGFDDLARTVWDEWQAAAWAMGVREDYHGYYEPALLPPLERAIDDMLIETEPRSCMPEEVAAEDWTPAAASPISLLNWAWQVYRRDPVAYRSWEATQIERLLTGIGE